MVRQRHPAGAYSRDTHTSSPIDFSTPDPASVGLYSSQSDVEPVSGLDLGAGSVTAGAIVDGTLILSKFAADIHPPSVVDVLPTLPDPTYPNGSLAVLTTDGKLYRNNDDVWNKAVDGVDLIADSVTAGAIAAGVVSAREMVSGTITTAQLAVPLPGGQNVILNSGFELGAYASVADTPITWDVGADWSTSHVRAVTNITEGTSLTLTSNTY